MTGIDQTLTTTAGPESSLDRLLDTASATGGRVTWGRSRLTGRHWVAVELLDDKRRQRRARTRSEAALRLLRGVYGPA